MARLAHLFLSLAFLYFFTISPISAQANSTINFQGKIVNLSNGTNIVSSCLVSGASNDTCDFRVRIYDAPSAGTMLFEETHSNVEIGESNGVFNLSLNSVCNDWVGGCAGSGIVWGNDPTIYIQIEFDPSGNGDFAEGEVFSRKLLQSVPYAYYADSAGSIGGLGVNGLVQLQPSSAQTATGSTALIWLNETGGGTPNLLELEVGGTNVFTVENDGSTSVGTSTSTAYLTIAGSTTSQASLRLMSSGGIDPSASNSGDLWWNGTNLYFNDGTPQLVDILTLDYEMFTDSGAETYLTSTTDDFVIGGTTVVSSVFSIDVSAGAFSFGSNGLVNPELVFENANSSVARIGYNVNNNFNIYNGTNDARVSLNKAIAEYEFDVNGTIQVSEDIVTDTPTTDDSTTEDVTEDVTTRVENWFRQKTNGATAVTVTDAVVDSSNNLYITGNFTGSVDLGGGFWLAGGTNDYFIVKFNSSGTFQWADREDGGSGNAFGLGVAVNNSTGDVYVTGNFTTAAVTFINPTSIAQSGGNYFLIKYNSSGTPQWVDTEDGGTGNAISTSVAVNSSTGDVYISGYFNTAATTFITPTSITPVATNDYFVMKYNSSGTPQWVDREDNTGAGNVQAFGIAVDSAGDVYVVGHFQSAATTFITPTALTPTAIDYFIIKYNSSGTPQWVDREDGGSGSVTPNGIVIDGSNNIFVFGTYLTAAVTFISPDSLTPTANDFFLIKYNTSGTPQWVVDESGGTGNSTLNNVSVGSSGEVFACGVFDGAVNFGDSAGLQSATGDNYVLITYNSSGVIQSTQTEIGGAGDSACYAADDVSSTTMMIAGQFGTSAVDFLGGSKSVVATDFFAFSQTTTTNTVIIDTIVTNYLYNGSDIGSYANAFANIYTYGLVARGAVTFETIVNVQGDILANPGTADYGDSTTISSSGDVGRHSEIILGSNGLPFMAAFVVGGGRMQTIGCNNITCTSPTITYYDGTGGTIGDNEITILKRGTGFPIVGFYESTGQDLEAIDCTTVSCSTGTPRNIELTASGQHSTAWLATSSGLPVWAFSRVAAGVLTGNTCTNVTCGAVGVAYIAATNSAGNEGQHPSAVVRSNGLPIIFSMDEDEGELEVSNCTSESCNAFEALRVLDNGGDGAGGVLVGEHVESSLGSNGYPIAVYRDVTNQSIKFIRCLDISCSTYEIRLLIDNVNDLGVNQLGLTLKGDGSPIISYHDETIGTLNVYECASSECSSGVNYQLTDGTKDEGEYSSIVRVPGSTDRFLISYYNRTDGDLKLFDYNKTYSGGANLGSSTNFFNNLYTANIFSKNASISNFDVAEEYKVEDESIEAGDVVRFKKDATDQLIVERTDKAYDGEVIGVISTDPGLYLKNWEENDGRGRPVALVGRVPVKVTDENGRIRRGDYLVASSTPGYAMKATEGGVIIGRAMEDFGVEGDSDLVAEQLQLNQEIVDTQVANLVDGGKLSDVQVDSATAYLAENTVTMEEPIVTNFTKGRIMMYVDLGYIDDKVFGAKEEVSNSLNILSYGMQNGDNLFELVEEVDRSELKINTEVVVKKSLAAERYRSTGGDFIVEVVGEGGFKVLGEGDEVLFGVDSKGKISLREGEGGSIGSVDMKVGEKEIRVLNSSVTDNSKIFIQPNKPVRYGVKDQVGGEGFTIEIPEPLTEDIKFNYWIIN